MTETPRQAVLDDIANVGPASGNARHRSNMIGFERMLHPEQKADPHDSEHVLPDFALKNKPYAKAASRVFLISLRSHPYQPSSPSPLRAETSNISMSGPTLGAFGPRGKTSKSTRISLQANPVRFSRSRLSTRRRS